MSSTKKELEQEKIEHCSVAAAPAKRIQIVGNAFVITSKLKFETLQKVEKYNTDALCLIEKKDNEENEIFRIATGKVASISKCGVVFAEANKAGYANATILFPANVKDKRTFIKENFGNAIFMLNTLETIVENACKDIEAAYAQLDEIIEEI